MARCVSVGLLLLANHSSRAVTGVPNLVGNWDKCGTNNRCIRGGLPVINNDHTFQFAINNPTNQPATLHIYLQATGDFSFTGVVDALLRLKSTFICKGSVTDDINSIASLAANLFPEPTCATHASYETIPAKGSLMYSINTKILPLLGAYDPRSTAQYKIEVVGNEGYLTGNVLSSAPELMVFAGGISGIGGGTVRHTSSTPINGGRPF